MPEGDALDQYIKDYNARREARLRRRHEVENAWEESIRVQQYAHTARAPELLTGIWNTDPSAVLSEDSPLRSALAQSPARPTRQMISDRQKEFASALEQAWETHKEEIPLSWFMQWDPVELVMLAGPDFVQTAETVYSIQQEMATQKALQNDINREAQKRFDTYLDRTTLQKTLSFGIVNHDLDMVESEVLLDKFRTEVENEMTGRIDQNFNEEIAEWRAALEASTTLGPDQDPKAIFDQVEALMRAQINSNPAADVKDLLDQQGFFHQMAMAGFSGAGQVFDKLAVGLGGLLSYLDRGFGMTALTELTGVPFGTTAWLQKIFEDAREEQIADAEARLVEPDQAWIEDAKTKGITAVWNEMQRASDPEYQTYLDMAGGDPVMAAGFFGMVVREQATVEDQLAGMLKEQKASEKEFIRELSEKDFRASSELLNVLGMWGRNVPGRLASAFTVILNDSDYWSPNVLNPMSDMWDEVGRKAAGANFSPAEVLGIDGSLAGLMLDLTGGIAFDPTTWLFGPRFGRGAGGLVDNATDAARIARGPVVGRFTDDIIYAAKSPDHGAYELYHLTSWLDDTHQAQMFDVIGLEANVVPKTYIPKARMWRVDTIKELFQQGDAFPTIAGKRSKGYMNADDAKTLADKIKANGFEEAVTVTYSRSSNTLHVTDGVKRILASDANGISHVPVVIKVVDDAAAGIPVLPGYSADEVLKVQKIAEGDFGAAARKGGALSAETETNVLTMAKSVLDRTPSQPVGVVSIDLENRVANLSIQRVAHQGGTMYVAVDEIGDIVAAVTGGMDGAVSAAVAQGSGLGRSGLMTQMWDLAAAQGDRFVLSGDALQSLSGSGAGFLQGYARRLLDQAVPQLPDTGRLVDDLLLPGESIKKNLKELGGGETTVAPDNFLPKRLIYGDVDMAQVDNIIEDAIMSGNVPLGAGRGALNAGFRSTFKAVYRKLGMDGLARFLRPYATTRRYETAGPGHITKITDDIVRLWGPNKVKANEWLGRVYEHVAAQRRLTAANYEKLKVLIPIQRRISQLKEANVWNKVADDLGRAADEALAAPGATSYDADFILQRQAQVKAGMKEIEHQLAAEERVLEIMSAKVYKELTAIPDSSNLSAMIKELWEDFVHTEVKPVWDNAEALFTETGDINWGTLTAGRSKDVGEFAAFEGKRQFFSTELRQIAAELDLNPENLYKMVSATGETPMGFTVPVSVLDLIGASTFSGRAWRQFTQFRAVNAVREVSHTLHLAWIIEKVMTPATAMVVSFDEVLRIFHLGGHQAVMRYFADKGLFAQARGRALLHGQNPLGKNAIRRGAEYMKNPRVRNRIQKLQDYPTYLKQAERQLFEGSGLGWTDIKSTDPHFFEAAQRWSAGMLQDSGFRAFLKGEDAFRDWFNSVDGLPMRNAGVVKRGQDGQMVTKVMSNWKDAYEGWTTLFDKVILKKAKDAGKFDEVRGMWTETANKIDELGGHPLELPTAALDQLDSVRGVQKVTGQPGIGRMTNAFFDRFFMDPINYRRGFLADMVRTSERQRLLKLFATHPRGFRVVSDVEIDALLGTKGLGGLQRSGAKSFMWEKALDNGFVPESYIDDLVERVVQREMDHVLYTWDKGSRAGKAATGVFPFAKPWADMVGFWGREMFKRPHTKGLVNKSNFMWFKNAGEGLSPLSRTTNGIANGINWRTPALVSRLASTDFTIDQGIHPDLPGVLGGGGDRGLLPGTEETDISPLLFLPTGGENPFGTILPGLGFLPIWGLDMVLAALYDPETQPVEYQELLDSVGDIVPSVHFGSPKLVDSFTRRAFGGGVGSRLAEVGADAVSWRSGQSMFSFNSLMGDIGREIDRNRHISAILADPEEWDIIFSITDQEGLDAYFRALSVEANQEAAAGNIGKSLTRVVGPATNKWDARLDVILEVWVQAAEQFPDLLGVRPSFNVDLDTASEEEINRYAGDVRKAFFEVSQADRDLMIAGFPQVAVNLVSNWEWTPEAITAQVPGSDTAYRTDGSRDGLLKHDLWVDLNYIRPIEPVERARRIIGLANAAKERSVKRIYEAEAERINEILWENVVEDKTKAILKAILDETDFGELWDVRSERELWEVWGQREDDVEELLARQFAPADISAEQLESFNKLIGVPNKEKAWGTSWPGLDDAEVSQRFQELTFNDFSDDTTKVAKVFGITLTPGMTGLQLFKEVQQVIAQSDNAVNLYVRPAYDTYVSARSAPGRAAEAELRKTLFNDQLNLEWRQGMEEYIGFAESISSRWRDVPLGVPVDEQLEVQARFMRLRNTSNTLDIDWERVWELKYQRDFGPLGWEPVPPRPHTVDGNRQEGAYIPFIKGIVDGDTLVVNTRAGGDTGDYQVRLLGVRARDYGLDDEGAQLDKDRLREALLSALDSDARIWLVRDAETFGNVDPFGRELAWLWIGDEPFYFPEEMRPDRDPSIHQVNDDA